MQYQLHTNLDALNNHGFGRAGLDTSAYAVELMQASATGKGLNPPDTVH